MNPGRAGAQPPRPLVRRARLGLVLGVGILAAWTVRSWAVRASDEGILHPDLLSIVPPEELVIEHGASGSRFLRFEHVIHNAGPGRLEVRPAYDHRSGTARSFQRLYGRDPGGTLRLVREMETEGIFAFHPPHEHYHFPAAEHAIFAIGSRGEVGARVAPSRKLGYCLGDTYIVAPNEHTPGPRSELLYLRETCADPRAVRGISPGWGDQYEADLEGQSIDVSHLPDGDYWFASTADPADVLREADEGNNRTLLKIRLGPDAVTVLEAPP